MQTPNTEEIISAFRYGSVLQSTINAANLFRAQQQQTGTLVPVNAIPDGSAPTLNVQGEGGAVGDKLISPFDPEAIVPLPFQLQEYRNLSRTVWRRNERERYRVRCVNEAYEHLRERLPYDEDEKRLSKVETLRLAIIYIKHLKEILCDDSHVTRCQCFVDFQAQLIESEARRLALR